MLHFKQQREPEETANLKQHPRKHLSRYPLLTEQGKRNHPYQIYLLNITLPLTTSHTRRTPASSPLCASSLSCSLYNVCLASQLWSCLKMKINKFQQFSKQLTFFEDFFPPNFIKEASFCDP